MTGPTAARGSFPYPHRTMAHVMRDEAAREREAEAFMAMDHEERFHRKAQAACDAAFRRALERAVAA